MERRRHMPASLFKPHIPEVRLESHLEEKHYRAKRCFVHLSPVTLLNERRSLSTEHQHKQWRIQSSTAESEQRAKLLRRHRPVSVCMMDADPSCCAGDHWCTHEEETDLSLKTPDTVCATGNANARSQSATPPHPPVASSIVLLLWKTRT